MVQERGDTIQEGEPLVAIETAKLETDLESVASGVVSHIMVPEGATVPIRTVLAVIGEPGEEVARPSGPASSPTAARVAAGAPPSSPHSRRATECVSRSSRQRGGWLRRAK